jgi:hypothetical protein
MTAKTWVDKFFASAEKSPVPLTKLNAIVTAADTLEAAQAALIDEQAAMAAAPPAEPTASSQAVTPPAPVEKAWAGAFFAAAEKASLPVADLNAIVAKSSDLAAAQGHLIDAMAAKANVNKPGPGGVDATGAAGNAAKAGLARAVQNLTGAKAPASNH